MAAFTKTRWRSSTTCRIPPSIRRLVAGLLAAAAAAGEAQAQTTSNWSSTTGDWTNAAMWSTNPIAPNNGQPNAADTYNAVLGTPVGAITLDAPITIQALTFQSGTIGGSGTNTLTLKAASTWDGGGFTG